MHTLQQSSTITAPVSVVFDYVTDYQTWPRWIMGIKTVNLLSDSATGPGAQFEGPLTIGAITLRSRVNIVEWKQDDSIVVETTKGIKSRSTWSFTSVSPVETLLSIDLEYELPGGLAGRALATLIHPFVSASIGHAEKSLRSQLDTAKPDRLDA